MPNPPHDGNALYSHDLRRRHMLKKLWSSLLPGANPPWITPRLVYRNTPEYDLLRARLDSVDVPMDERSQSSALEVLRDRITGQCWDVIVIDHVPSPLYALRPHASQQA